MSSSQSEDLVSFDELSCNLRSLALIFVSRILSSPTSLASDRAWARLKTAASCLLCMCTGKRKSPGATPTAIACIPRRSVLSTTEKHNTHQNTKPNDHVILPSLIWIRVPVISCVGVLRGHVLSHLPCMIVLVVHMLPLGHFLCVFMIKGASQTESGATTSTK